MEGQVKVYETITTEKAYVPSVTKEHDKTNPRSVVDDDSRAITSEVAQPSGQIVFTAHQTRTASETKGESTPVKMMAGESTPTNETDKHVQSEEGMMLLQTPQQEQTYSQHVIVADNAASSQIPEVETAETSNPPGTISYTVTSYDVNAEYSEMDPKSLTQHYGQITPYGTFAKSDTEREYQRYSSVSPDELRTDSGLRSPGSNSSDFRDSFSASMYSSLLRPSHKGTHKVNLNEHGMSYVDFVPRKTKEKFHKKTYLTFTDCMQQANEWLSTNNDVSVKRCESVRHRLDNAHKLNPESTTSHDRSYVIGLRLWYKVTKKDGNTGGNRTLAHRNFIPRYLNPDKHKSIKPNDRPYFEDLPKTLGRLNEQLKNDPLLGQLVDIETVPLNYSVVHRPNGLLETDATYCCLDFQGPWEFFIIRLFYFEHDLSPCIPVIERHDFAPSPLMLPPARPQFQTLSSLLCDANKWMKNHPGKRMLAMSTVEFPFKMKMLIASKGHVNTNNMSYEPTRDSVHQHTLRVLRLWVCNEQFVEEDLRPSSPLRTPSPLQREEEFDVLTFVPRQLTAKGCCGAQKAMFTTSHDTVERMNEWLRQTGAEVIDVQTDNIERWSGSSFDLHAILPERTYNKEDYREKLSRSALEYRLTVFRVYYRPKSLGHHNVVTPDKPVKPCCCFVGCNVM